MVGEMMEVHRVVLGHLEEGEGVAWVMVVGEGVAWVAAWVAVTVVVGEVVVEDAGKEEA